MVIDAETHETMEFYAKIVVNASTLGSTFLLLNSTSEAHPEGMGNAGQLGHNLMDHHFRCGAEGSAEGFEDKYTYGRRANGIYIPRYQNIGNDKRDYLRGFGYQGGASRGLYKEVAELALEAILNTMSLPANQWSMGLGGFGEMLPYYENRVYIDHSKRQMGTTCFRN
jgi:choline dehydrogenase-like flavoprotein